MASVAVTAAAVVSRVVRRVQAGGTGAEGRGVAEPVGAAVVQVGTFDARDSKSFTFKIVLHAVQNIYLQKT